MKRFVIVCLALCLVTGVFCNTITQFSGQVLMEVFANTKADIALGTPITVGETVYLPLFKAETGFYAGAAGENSAAASGSGGAIKLMPFAIAMLSPTSVTVYPISNEKTFFEQLLEGLPELIPFIKELLFAFLKPTLPEAPGQLEIESESETPLPITSTVKTESATYLELYTRLLTFQNEFLETAQDAYSYFLIGDPAIKGEYAENLHQAERAMMALENLILTNDALKTAYAIELLNQLKIGLFSVRNALEALFVNFEKNGEVSTADLLPLLKQLEGLNRSFQQITQGIEEQVLGAPAFLESVARTISDTGLPPLITYHFAALNSDVFQFVEQVYRLCLLPDAFAVSVEGLLEEKRDIEAHTAQMKTSFEHAQSEEIGDVPGLFDPMTTLFQTISELVERGFAIAQTAIAKEAPTDGDILAFKTLVDIYTRLIDTIKSQLKEELVVPR